MHRPGASCAEQHENGEQPRTLDARTCWPDLGLR
jgi:hypothetical protein